MGQDWLQLADKGQRNRLSSEAKFFPALRTSRRLQAFREPRTAHSALEPLDLPTANRELATVTNRDIQGV